MPAASDKGPIRLPLITQPENRAFDTSVDAKVVDCYAEKSLEGDYNIYKRPEWRYSRDSSSGVGLGQLGQGVFQWENLFMEMANGNLYSNGVLVGSPGIVSGLFWFNITLGTPSYLYMSIGTRAYTYSSAGVFAQIVDPAYPPLTVPGSAYLDGTLYVMDSKARIWGSKTLNNPNTWDPLNVIVAQMEPDQGIALAKQLLYVVAFKETSTEFFYDAGASQGTLTGSPLLPVQNAKIGYGCAGPCGSSVQSINDILYFISTTRAGQLAVGEIKNLRYTQISSPAVDRFLTQNLTSYISAYGFKANGHTFYIIRFTSTNLVYDIDAGLWYYWNNPNTVLTFSGSANNASSGLFQGDDGTIYFIPTTTYPPGAVLGVDTNKTLKFPIIGDIITPNFDGGVKLKKTLTRLKVIADQNTGGELLVRWSDDDYKSWSNWRSVDLRDARPNLPDCGTFYKRAFWFRHSSAAPVRIRAVEPELLVGSI